MDNKSLVEAEGVNAGSAEQIDDDRASGDAPAAVRDGGRADQVENKAPVADLDPPADGAEARSRAQSERFPEREYGSAGQDAGSIE